MKKFILVSSLLVLFATPSWGIMIDDSSAGTDDGTDLGSVDTYISDTNLLSNSNPTTETAWVNSVLASSGITATFAVKDEPVTYYGTDTANTFAFSMSSTPEYFLIKNAKYWALYQNQADLGWGVFDSTYLPPRMNLSSGFKISHVSQFGTGSTSVPEPSTTLLLGAGLLGFGLYSRKRSKK
ncbi:hypothetical protein CXF72_04545 [Psychromonas sp. MB-3u-54]|uniref:PEP-CTERM sorting domain-containing protein n=1 Tax=Psychromonas sp. MB-3u-54 TaxID=2058319 RepID=UPI000C327427|nr:PEP-CTERM sorting domain-containing protein [Psychromonas sp. MB-3u-54]PKH03774.1 hypothetical protein CXF72_04545 [Psychromonas sp. MB-3u-54]